MENFPGSPKYNAKHWATISLKDTKWKKKRLKQSKND